MGKPRILTPVEVRGLKQNGIKRLDDLWERVGDNYDLQIGAVSQATGVSRAKLGDLLAAREGRATEFTEGSWGGAIWLWLKRLRRLPLRLEGGIFLLLMLLSLLLLRALGVGENLPSPVGLRPRVLVAKRNLRMDAALKPEDFYSARLVPGGDYFPYGEQLAGCVLTQDLAWGSALRFTQVKRQQLVTTKDIQTDTDLGAGTVSLTWTSYQPNALTDLKQVEGRSALLPIPSGRVVLFDYVK